MKNNTIPDVCSCRFTTKALGDFIDTFGRLPMSNKDEDCRWVGKQIDLVRNFPGYQYIQVKFGRDAIVSYWKCRRMGKIVPLGGNKVGMNPI